MTVHRLIGSPLAAIIFLVTAGTVSAQTQKELLDELDRTIEEAESYVSAKEVRIKTIETLSTHVESLLKDSTGSTVNCSMSISLLIMARQ